MPSDAPTAFFSYSREDSEFVLRLAEDLKAAGANVWLDQLDIVPGQRWARAVQEALNNAERVLVVLSPASVSSTNVEDEVTFALEEHKTVIPIFYKDCKIPFQLRPFQHIDFRTDYDRALKIMLKTLGANKILETTSASPAAAVMHEETTGAAKANAEPDRVTVLTHQADEGDARAMAELGYMYRTGKGVERDKKQSFSWYQRAAERGDVEGMFDLALLYVDADADKDLKKAVFWYRKAAEAGHRHAMYKLAYMYERGQGLERDYAQAITWYSKARELGVVEAQGAMERVTFLQQEREKAAEQQRLEEKRKAEQKARSEREERGRQAAEQARLEAEQQRIATETADPEQEKSERQGILPERLISAPYPQRKTIGNVLKSVVFPNSVWGKTLAVGISWAIWNVCFNFFLDRLNNYWTWYSSAPRRVAIVFLFRSGVGLILAICLGWTRRPNRWPYAIGLTATWAIVGALNPDVWRNSQSTVGPFVADAFEGLLLGTVIALLLQKTQSSLTKKQASTIVLGFVAANLAHSSVLAYGHHLGSNSLFLFGGAMLIVGIIGSGVMFWQLSSPNRGDPEQGT